MLLDREGKLWVTDFGLARIQSGGELTHTGDVLGTLRYMSPEQLTDNKVVDHRTDVYSLGLTLYELLARRPALANVPREQLVNKILGEEPTPLRKIDPAIPLDLETIVLRATAKDREARYQSASELADDLLRFVQRKPILARRPTHWQRLRYWTRRNPALATTIAALLLAMSLLSIGGPLMAWRQRQVADTAMRNLFIADMNMAYDAWYQGNVDRAEELLEKHAGVIYNDNRDFPQSYMKRLIRVADETILFKHDERFNGVAVSPDGRLIACSGTFPGVLIVDLESGHAVRTLSPSDEYANTVAFSPDGTLLVAGHDMSISIWDAQTWQLLTVQPAHINLVSTVRFASNSETFAVGSVGGELSVWDRNGRRFWTASDHKGKIYVAYSPDNQTLAVGSEDHHVTLWDVTTGELKRNVARLDSLVFGIQWARDGELLIVAAGEGIRYFDPKSGDELLGLRYHVRSVASLAVQGDLLATGGHDFLLQFWDIESGLRLGLEPAHRAQVRGLAFTPDGRRLVTAGDDGAVRVFNLDHAVAYQQHVRHVDGSWPTSVAITHDGSTCVSVTAPLAFDQSIDDPRGEFVVWDVATGIRRHSAPIAVRFGAMVAVSADARVCASAGWGGVQLWDLASVEPSRTLIRADHLHFWSVAVSPDGRWVVAGGHEVGDARLSRGSLLTIWDVSTEPPQAETLVMTKPRGMVYSLDFSSDNQRFVAGSGDWVTGAIDGWTIDQGTWRLSNHLSAHQLICTGAAFIPNTELIATSGWDGVLGVRHPLGGANRSHEFRGQTDGVFSLAVSPDGMLIASGAGDVIRFWDRLSGDQLAALQVPMWVSSLAFTPDGRTLVWGGGDGTVHFERTGD